jgi:hypothetical protein
MKNWLSLVSLAALCSVSTALAVPAMAGEPSGFGDFAWGTPRDHIAQDLADDCSRQIRLETVRGQSLLCYDYDLRGVGSVLLTLEFADGTLQGYGVRVSGDRAAALKRLSERRFGAPMASGLAGVVLSWSWPTGERALFDEHCLAWDDACLTVRTPKIVRAGMDAAD